MADKYQCTAIRSHLVNHINDDWPKDLEAWVELDIRDALHRENYYFDEEMDLVWPGRILPDPAASLRFFKGYGKKDMLRSLPAIIYDLARCKLTENYDEPCQEDFAVNAARWYLLDSWDLLVVSRTKELITKTLFSAIPFGGSTVPNNCSATNIDNKTIAAFWDTLREEAVSGGDILRTLDQWIGGGRDVMLGRDLGVCYSCAGDIYQVLADLREEVWGIMEESSREYAQRFELTQ